MLERLWMEDSLIAGDHELAGRATRARPTPPGGVSDLARAPVDCHLRPHVRKTVGTPGDEYRQQTSDVQRVEPNAGRSVRAPHVRADVGFRKGPQVGDGRHAGNPNPLHVEGNQPYPSTTIERVYLQAGREPFLNNTRVVWPMHIREIAPALPHDGSRHRGLGLGGIGEIRVHTGYSEVRAFQDGDLTRGGRWLRMRVSKEKL